MGVTITWYSAWTHSFFYTQMHQQSCYCCSAKVLLTLCTFCVNSFMWAVHILDATKYNHCLLKSWSQCSTCLYISSTLTKSYYISHCVSFFRKTDEPHFKGMARHVGCTFIMSPKSKLFHGKGILSLDSKYCQRARQWENAVMYI